MEERDKDLENIRVHIENLKRLFNKQELLDVKDSKGNTITDLSHETGIPGVDLSEGMKQIDEKNKEIDGVLDVLIGQMKTIEGHAINIKDTLEVQSKLLDKIGEDVDKYDKQLGDLNEKNG